ncbi:MAG: hypothetical protein RIS47_1785 [Bacteroidota bacterium]|jgi:hypothetical protein
MNNLSLTRTISLIFIFFYVNLALHANQTKAVNLAPDPINQINSFSAQLRTTATQNETPDLIALIDKTQEIAIVLLNQTNADEYAIDIARLQSLISQFPITHRKNAKGIAEILEKMASFYNNIFALRNDKAIIAPNAVSQ